MNSVELSNEHALGEAVTLLIDAGNTRIKWACVAAKEGRDNVGSWLAFGSISHCEFGRSSIELPNLNITRALISNVAGEAAQAALEQLLCTRYPDIALRTFKASPACAGLTNTYDHPAQLGSDRFASAIAAHTLFPRQAIVIATCGTATTVDALNANTFAGGMILPGLQVMAHALSSNTAALPQVAEDLALPTLFATNTAHAIISGCIHAQVGAIQCALAELSLQAGTPARLLISGGAAMYLLPHLQKYPASVPWQITHLENLVLMGLNVVVNTQDYFATTHTAQN